MRIPINTDESFNELVAQAKAFILSLGDSHAQSQVCIPVCERAEAMWVEAEDVDPTSYLQGLATLLGMSVLSRVVP